MGWYLAQLLFAQATEDPEASVLCESSYVLFEAASAVEAYQKSEAWGHRHESGSSFSFFGVAHLNSVREPPGDGVEVGGGFFEEPAAWSRQHELIPPRDEIPVIVLERNLDTPIGELMSEEQRSTVHKLLAGHPDSSEPPN